MFVIVALCLCTVRETELHFIRQGDAPVGDHDESLAKPSVVASEHEDNSARPGPLEEEQDRKGRPALAEAARRLHHVALAASKRHIVWAAVEK